MSNIIPGTDNLIEITIVDNVMKADIKFGYFDRFARFVAEYKGQNIKLSQLSRNMETSRWACRMEIPKNDFNPIIKYFEKFKRTKIYVEQR